MPTTIFNIKFYTANEVEQMFGVSRVTVYNHMRRGNLKGVKVGRTTLISEESLRDFITLGGQIKGDNEPNETNTQNDGTTDSNS